MKLAVIREHARPGGAEAVGGTTTRDVEVPNSAVAKLSAIFAAFLTLAQILASFVTSYTGLTSGRVQTELARERGDLVEANFRVQLLQRVLEETDTNQRRESLKLLLASGLLDDEGGKLAALLNTSNYVPPLWKTRALEPLKDTLPLMGGGAAQQQPTGGTRAGAGTGGKEGNTAGGGDTKEGNGNSSDAGTNKNSSNAGGNTSSQ